MEENKQKHSNKLPFLLIGLLVLAVVCVMTYRQMKGSGNTTTCNAVPQSAFGQGQSQTWVQMDSAAQSAIGAGFELSYPDDAVNADYDSVQYWSYTQQIDEHRYYSGEKEVFRIAKGKMCGEALYTPNSTYASTVIAKVGDIEVTEYGDGETVTAASWVNGAYSYFIGAFGQPMQKDRIEELVSEIK